MAAPDLVNLSGLMDDAKCFVFVRQHRWPGGVQCPGCSSPAVVRDRCDDTQPARQRYRCKACASRLDDLTGTVLAGLWIGVGSGRRYARQAIDIKFLIGVTRGRRSTAGGLRPTNQAGCGLPTKVVWQVTAHLGSADGSVHDRG